MTDITTEITTTIEYTAFDKPFTEYTPSEVFLGILVLLALVALIYTFTKKRGV